MILSTMQANQEQLAGVVDALEEDIVLGRLRPHQELVEDVLMQRFGIKRHLARAAILDLAGKGLVVKARNKASSPLPPRESRIFSALASK